MSSPFQTEQMTLAQLFSGQHVFSFPAFQRPYRWTEEEALTLIDDVAAASERSDPGYFLGNLVLTPAEGRISMVIDGRQRLTTLFMLISILRDLEPDPRRAAGLHRLIYDAPDEAKGISRGWRLRFSQAEQRLIEQRLADMKHDDADPGEENTLSSRYYAMFEVAEAMRKLLSRPTAQTGLPRLEDFTDYLLNHCEVIVLKASSANSGLRLFQVLNNRGVQLSEADLIKPDLLQMLPEDRQPDAALIWDKLEDRLGSDNLDMVLRCYIFIVSGEWVPAGRNFASSLKAAMMSRGAETFHFEDLQKYGDAFAEMHWGDIPYDEPEQNPNLLIQSLHYLGRTENDWKEFMPIALEILVRNEGEYAEIYRQISALERAFMVWYLTDAPEAFRRQASINLIDQMRAGVDLFADGNGFDLPEADLDAAITRISSPFPKLSQRNALVRRMELLLCEAAGKSAPQYLELATASQVLPKDPRRGSQWALDFTRQQHRECVDLIGNCVPLTRETDQRVGNRDFRAKKKIYQDAGLAGYFRSVGDVCTHSVWTRADIHDRTEKLASLIAEKWRTIPTEPQLEDEFDWDDEEEETVEADAPVTADPDGEASEPDQPVEAEAPSDNTSETLEEDGDPDASDGASSDHIENILNSLNKDEKN